MSFVFSVLDSVNGGFAPMKANKCDTMRGIALNL